MDSPATTCDDSELVPINIRTVPRELRDRFKIVCAENQITMQDAVILLLQKAVRGDVQLTTCDLSE